MLLKKWLSIKSTIQILIKAVDFRIKALGGRQSLRHLCEAVMLICLLNSYCILMLKLSILLILHVVYFIFEIHMFNFNVTYDFFFQN